MLTFFSERLSSFGGKKWSPAFPCDVTIDLREVYWPEDDFFLNQLGSQANFEPISISRGKSPLDWHGLG